jgi:hypothetical protein
MLPLTRPLGLALIVCSVVAVLGCRPRAARSLERAEVREHLALTTLIGREIHRRDMLTWSAGELVRATVPPDQQRSIEAWAIDADHPETDVLFFDELGRELHVSFVVHCERGAENCRVETPSETMPVSDRNLAQAWAVRTAETHPAFVQTSQAYNSVVIPTGDGPDADWWVYLIALDPNPNLVMLGQHYRFVVDADGRTVESFRSFSDGADVIELPEGARPISITISHFLDELPTEMHVWAAIYHELDIVVATNVASDPEGMPLLWMVDSDGTISPID